MNISSADLKRIERRAMWRSNATAIVAIAGLLALNGLMTAWDKQAQEKMAANSVKSGQKHVADNSSRRTTNTKESP